ncbi:hypothetical protein XTPLMG728_2910 [Xanthomonas translucens pv. poae]|uniref:Uncharacterized protein n=1 Tax=Xanthomonas graminis pv. poae TaxID=227946 RepID=A0A0K3A2F8_9XANT|nr:hypothetical protein [Xanthomonas translucens]UKE62053.1 hypothetical protein KM539_00210 [Xanthomonas translucens pv. poae]CTP91467.1 hypothetical protein XTPLMG728_2910 [Xanthomonas translucens pv. poae]
MPGTAATAKFLAIGVIFAEANALALQRLCQAKHGFVPKARKFGAVSVALQDAAMFRNC